LIRREGKLVEKPNNPTEKRIKFIDKERISLPVTLGDLVTAYHTTGIPNITTYVGLSEREASMYKRNESIYRRLFSFRLLRRFAQQLATVSVQGPDEHVRQTHKSQVWVWARNDAGMAKEAWLETAEAYQFTAVAGVRGVEEILNNQFQGALTPGLAFGANFALSIPGSRRVNPKLPHSSSLN
jgi:short subunit dehydrogenase-like uncharacterized protein